MSGSTDFTFYTILALSAVAAISDLCLGKIYNWMTLPALLAGIALSAVHFGWMGAVHSVVAAALALLLYGWMFWLGVMGGGDVKMLMALGALGGIHYVVNVALLSVLFGGALAIILLAFRGKLVVFLGKMRRFVLSVFVKELEIEAPKIDRQQTMPYGIPIACAAIAVALNEGLRLWK